MKSFRRYYIFQRVEIPYIGRTKYTKRDKSIIDKIFIQIPTRTMSGILKYPEPKTTALGGVATGA